MSEAADANLHHANYLCRSSSELYTAQLLSTIDCMVENITFVYFIFQMFVYVYVYIYIYV